MTELTEAVKRARQQALIANGNRLHWLQFDVDVMTKRAADEKDPATADAVTEMSEPLEAGKGQVAQIAKAHGSTMAKILAVAEDTHHTELKASIKGWSDVLEQTQDILDHPEIYGEFLLDGRTPRPSDDQLRADIMGLRAAIAHAREITAEIEDPAPKRPKRATS